MEASDEPVRLRTTHFGSLGARSPPVTGTVRRGAGPPGRSTAGRCEGASTLHGFRSRARAGWPSPESLPRSPKPAPPKCREVRSFRCISGPTC